MFIQGFVVGRFAALPTSQSYVTPNGRMTHELERFLMGAIVA
jgi:hypothetical protein